VETARKAERALRNELGDPSLTFVAPSHLAGTEGLLAGEKRHLDLRRMELAHLDLHRREYELTAHVSLQQVAPLALVELRATGRCAFAVGEEFFDLHTPGHYFRRISSVTVTIPCVTGPYTGVACTARLLRSTVRISPLVGEGYARDADGDTRFADQLGSTEVVVTSSGTNDPGLFETNPRNERLLPFELCGAVGEWQLELPADPRTGPGPFDYTTITDVILHIRHTAREGGQALRHTATSHLRSLIAQAKVTGSPRLLSARHEFPAAWAAFTAATPNPATRRAPLTLHLRREHYPFFAIPSALTQIEVIARHQQKNGIVEVADHAENGAGTRVLKLGTEIGDLRRGRLVDTQGRVKITYR